MFVAIYSFDVKPTEETAFLNAWEALTVMIKDHLGGWGSRIHKSDEGQYIAYAQWPSRDFWERDNADLLPEEAAKHRAIMKGACTEIKTVYRLEMIRDLLIHDPSKSQ